MAFEVKPTCQDTSHITFLAELRSEVDLDVNLMASVEAIAKKLLLSPKQAMTKEFSLLG